MKNWKMSAEKKTVLVVEDDDVINSALVEGLENAGIKVLTAFNGKEGLKMALKHHPSLILLDLMMPVKNGHEMLADLRKDKWGATAKVTVLTNASDNLDIYMAKKENVTHYAIKSSMKLKDIVKLAESRLNEQ